VKDSFIVPGTARRSVARRNFPYAPCGFPAMTASARSSALLIFRALTYVLGVLTSVLVARALGSFKRGVWAVALLVSSLASLLSELGLGLAVFSLSRQMPERRSAVRWHGALSSLAAGVLASGLAGLLVRSGALPFVGGVPGDVLGIALGGVALTNL